jgi:protein-tyrosine phosphatase
VVSRRLNWPDCLNARDLGGLPRQGGVTRAGVMVRSDTMVHLTAAGREAVGAYGVTSVIDLRSPAEMRGAPNPFARTTVSGRGQGPDTYRPAYAHIPLVDDSGMRRLGEAPGMFERYLMMLDQRPKAFRAVFRTAAQSEGAVVVHCFAGKDRTGLIAALMLAVAGVPDGAIAADFAETDVHLAQRYEDWVAAAPLEQRDDIREELRCPPERILGVLDHLRRKWGGVEGYLESAGLKPTELDHLRARFI